MRPRSRPSKGVFLLRKGCEGVCTEIEQDRRVAAVVAKGAVPRYPIKIEVRETRGELIA